MAAASANSPASFQFTATESDIDLRHGWCARNGSDVDLDADWESRMLVRLGGQFDDRWPGQNRKAVIEIEPIDHAAKSQRLPGGTASILGTFDQFQGGGIRGRLRLPEPLFMTLLRLASGRQPFLVDVQCENWHDRSWALSQNFEESWAVVGCIVHAHRDLS